MNLEEIKIQYEEIEAAYESNEISAEEYESLLQGLAQLDVLNDNAEDTQMKQDIRTAIETSLKVASLLA